MGDILRIRLCRDLIEAVQVFTIQIQHFVAGLVSFMLIACSEVDIGRSHYFFTTFTPHIGIIVKLKHLNPYSLAVSS